MAGVRQFCTFMVDGLYCGLEIAYVQEILEGQHIVPVPLAPPVVSGLINLRGQIITALDMRRRMNMPDRPAGQEPAVIVVQTEEGAMSLLVDEIGDVSPVPDATFEPAPDTVPEDIRKLIFGTCKLKERLLIILNLHTILMPEADPDGSAADDLSLEDPSAEGRQPEFDS
jgi:purine-binding chemotaxis protein CheW